VKNILATAPEKFSRRGLMKTSRDSFIAGRVGLVARAATDKSLRR